MLRPDRDRDSGSRVRRAVADALRGRDPGASAGREVRKKWSGPAGGTTARTTGGHYLLGMGGAHPGRDAPERDSGAGQGTRHGPPGKNGIARCGSQRQDSQTERANASGTIASVASTEICRTLYT